MAQDHRGGCARTVLVGIEPTAEFDRRLQQLDAHRADRRALHALGIAAFAADVRGAILIGGVVEAGLLLGSQLGEFLPGQTLAIVGIRVGHRVDRDNPLLLGKRQAAQDDAIDDREHRGVHADAQPEGEDADNGKGRVLGQSPDGKTEIGQHGVWG